MLGRPSQTILRGQKFLNIHKARCDAILRLLDEGSKQGAKSQEVNPALGEVEITECLRDSLRAVLQGQVAEWGKKVWVFPGTDSRSTPDARRPAGITDIPIAFTDILEAHGDHDAHAIIDPSDSRISIKDWSFCCDLFIAKENSVGSELLQVFELHCLRILIPDKLQ